MSALNPKLIWGFPKIRGTFLGVPIIRTIIFLGLYWGSPILGNHHLGFIGFRVCSTKPEALNPKP